MDEFDRHRGCLLGLAVGDAVGTTLEFTPRERIERPLTGLVGGGPFRLRPGEWTDDTSMALCLGASLLERGGFDPADQMRRYVRWRREGYMASNGRCFDIGGTVRRALDRFLATGEPFSGSTARDSAGNGSLMRLAPVAIRYARDPQALERFAADSSRTTHGAAECLEACRLFARLLARALAGAPKSALLVDPEFEGVEPAVLAIARGDYRAADRDRVFGTGYVVRSLEAALWCFDRGATFEEAVLLAANLGDDADTTAAICGQIAGAHHGRAGIPAEWLRLLVRREEIEEMAVRLARAGA